MLELIHKARYVVIALLGLVFGAMALMWPATDEATPAIEQAPVHIELPGIETETFQPQRTSFAVRAGDIITSYNVFGIFVMPGDEVPIRPVLSFPGGPFELHAEDGHVLKTDHAEWTWQAPDEPGLYRLSVTNQDETMVLNAFVKTPFDHQSHDLNGFRIGEYERETYQDNPAFERPEGFFEVTPQNRDVRVSPHFTVGEFLSNQDDDYPKYLTLQEPLFIKLERLLEAINEAGIETNSLHVMSAFRTPWYNRSIGNTTSFSQHLYGGAADVFVDTEGNGYMDDLTGSGNVTIADAEFLAGLVEEVRADIWYMPLEGGLGIYGPASHRSPFIHVDIRGDDARW